MERVWREVEIRGVLRYHHLGGLLGDVLMAKVACDLVHIPIECTQLDELANRHVPGPGPGGFQSHQVGIRDCLELAPLKIELALWVTHTIPSGVNGCTPRQSAIAVPHLCYDHRNPENSKSECGGNGGAPFTTIFEGGPCYGNNHPLCCGGKGTRNLVEEVDFLGRPLGLAFPEFSGVSLEEIYTANSRVHRLLTFDV